jgi:hypothetical protein
MSVLYPSHSPGTSRRCPRVPRTLWIAVFLALALALGFELSAALESPGQVIRGELVAAGADLRSPAVVPNASTLARLRGHFRDRDVTIDTAFWPLVSVTLHHVDTVTCRDAAANARRIEGLVVIALERYPASVDCHDANDMTWRLMP